MSDGGCGNDDAETAAIRPLWLLDTRLQRVSLAVKKEVGGDSQTAKIPDLDILVNAISSQLLRSSKAIIGSNESLDRSLTASA
jgi:hypothetical protein